MNPTRPSLIARVTALSVARPWLFIGAALLLAGASIWAASHLEIRSDFKELLPSEFKSVQEVQELTRRVGGDGDVLVIIQTLQGPSGLKDAESVAEPLAQEIMAMGPSEIRAVESKITPVESWFEEHWPLFASVKDLEKARDTLREEVRKRKLQANPLAVELDDDEAAQQPAAAGSDWLDPKQPLPRELVQKRFAQYVDGYQVHPDRTSLTLLVRPAGTGLSVTDARALMDKLQAIVDRHAQEYRDKHLRIAFAGGFPLFIAEYTAIISDVAGTALLVITAVVLSMMLFFGTFKRRWTGLLATGIAALAVAAEWIAISRGVNELYVAAYMVVLLSAMSVFTDFRSTVSLALSLLVAVAVTFGATWLVIGYLNTQTAFLGAIVVGNGVNYGLIYLARLRQLRWRGVPLSEACVEAAETTARATLLASAATSVSFGVLIFAANRGFRHFGFIGGLGMLLCWLFTFTLVPAFLSLFERARGAPEQQPDSSEGAEYLPALRRIFAHPRLIVGAFAVLSVIAAALFVRQLPTAMERNLDNLTNDTAKGNDTLKKDHARAQGGLGKSIAGSVALLDSREEADAFCDEIDRRASKPPNDALIDGCTTISFVVPRQQKEKLAVIKQILDELPDSLLQRVPEPGRDRLRQVREQLAAQHEIAVDQAPHTLLDKFRERDGHVGRLAVITAKPDAHIEVAENLQAFVAAQRDVPVNGKLVDATGANVIFADLLKDIEVEGPRTTLLSFLGVLVLVFIFFRNLRTSLEVGGSLFIGVVLMCGAAAAIGLKINFFNFIVFPITFGIAVDYGANVAARVRERGGDVIASMAEVGPAIALCSWTSIIGYGTLLYSLNRALRSFGWYAMIGEVTTITTALVLLPALLILANPRKSDGA